MRRTRKDQRELRSVLWQIGRRELTCVLFNNAVADRQTQAGSFAHRLGRKKWIKNTRQVLWRNPHAIVRS